MSRRSHTDGGSLELLLDTICNTFGGILFLAILITVLLRMAGQAGAPRVVEPDQVKLLELQAQHAEVTHQLEQLQSAAEQLEETIEDFGTAENLELLEVRRDHREEKSNLQSEKNELISDIGQAQAESNEIAITLQAIEQEAEREERVLAERREELSKELAARTREAATPSVQEATTAGVAIVLRYGRFYVWHNYSSYGDSLGLNKDDFVVVRESIGGTHVTPKPYAGLKLTRQSQDLQRLNSRIEQFNRLQHHFIILVWDDSFEGFQVLKEQLVQRGFRYQLWATNEGGIADRGGDWSGVQ